MAKRLEDVIAVNEKGITELASIKLDKVHGIRLDELLLVGAALADVRGKYYTGFTSYKLAEVLGLDDANVQGALSHAECSDHLYRDGIWYHLNQNSYKILFANAFEILSPSTVAILEEKSPGKLRALRQKSYRAQVREMIDDYIARTTLPNNYLFLDIQVRGDEMQLTLSENGDANRIPKKFSITETGYDKTEHMAIYASLVASAKGIGNVSSIQNVPEFASEAHAVK